ncbi:MAG TPA: hypothetical protein DEP24_05605, partial [Mycobacterium sp.]|nr:hypothetical protein [Mycobacterium sp.]
LAASIAARKITSRVSMSVISLLLGLRQLLRPGLDGLDDLGSVIRGECSVPQQGIGAAAGVGEGGGAGELGDASHGRLAVLGAGVGWFSCGRFGLGLGLRLG